MFHNPDEDHWIVRPKEAGTLRDHVLHHATGILRLRYPAPQGSKHAVLPDAISKYGPALFETMHNIVEEVEESRQTCTVSVTWNDAGAPKLNVIRRRIIDPLMN